MSGVRLRVALVASVVFAFPIVTLVSSMLVFPILFYAAIAIVANFGPLAILATHGLSRLGLRVDRAAVFEAWAYCSIIWVGCAFGISRWGEVGRSLGARNQPFFEVLFAPWRMLIEYVMR
jgi:hypothetical protein